MDELTIQGIQALKRGERSQARTLFLASLEKNEDDLQAWLWLSGAVENDQDRLDCLKQVLRIDPNHDAATKGVAYLTAKGVVSTEPEQVIPPFTETEEVNQTPTPVTAELPTQEVANQEYTGLTAMPQEVTEQVASGEDMVEPPPVIVSEAPHEDVAVIQAAQPNEWQPEQNELVGTTEPAENVEMVSPTVPVETTEPIENVEMVFPTAPVGAIEPAENVEMVSPTAPVGTTEPTENVEMIASTALVGTTEPAEKMEMPPTAAPVGTIEPAENQIPTPVAEPEAPFQIPKSFFSTGEEEKETSLDWINKLDEGKPAEPSAASEPSLTASVDQPPFSASQGEEPVVEPLAPVQTPEQVETPKKPEEKILQTIHPSLVTVMLVYGVGSLILLVLTLGFAIVSANASFLPVIIGLVLLGCLLIACLVVFIVRTVHHLTSTYILTDRRVFLESGVVRQSQKSVQLTNIEDLVLKQGILQKIVGMGNIHIQSENGEINKLIDVAKARQVMNRIQQELPGSN